MKFDSYNLSPYDVANWFICNLDREAGDSITHLKLQKLLYYAQAWTMVLENKTLFSADFQAWAHGPVLPEIYYDYKVYGFNSIPSCSCENNVPSEAEDILWEIKRIYGEKSAKYLEELTHTETPWLSARGHLSPEERTDSIISKSSMYSFYKSLLSEDEQETKAS